MVTVREVRSWMKKFKMSGISEVTSSNKEHYLDAVLKIATTKSGGKMDFAKQASVDIQEDFGLRYKDDMIILDKAKKSIKKEDINPDVDVIRYLERQLKLVEAKAEVKSKERIKIKLPKSSQLEYGRESVGLQ